jgi:hypothetical protein
MSGDSSIGIGIGLALKSYGRAFRGLLNQYPGAAAAYSLRKLSGAVSNVVRVRRSSDDAEQDFTAAQVDNGTLVNFANNGTSALYGNKMYFDGVDDAVNFTPISMSGDLAIRYSSFTLERQQQIIGKGTLGSYIRINNSVNEITQIRIQTETAGFNLDLTSIFNYDEVFTIVVKRISGVWGIYDIGDNLISDTFSNSDTFIFDSIGLARGSFAKGIVFDVFIDSDGNGTYDFNVQGYGNTDADWEDQIGSNDGTVNGSPALYSGQGFDGFVATWYDQSGNGLNAAQATTTAQPQIVSAGTLVPNGLLFSGSQSLSVSGISISENTTFGVSQWSTVNVNNGLYQIGTVNQTSALFVEGASGSFAALTARRLSAHDVDIGVAPALNTDILYTVSSLNDRQEIFEDGVSLGANETDVTLSTANTATIGGLSSSIYLMRGKQSELIIYPSDQTANRTAIESNIMTAYAL